MFKINNVSRETFKKILAFLTLTSLYRSGYPATSFGYGVEVRSRSPEYLQKGQRGK